MAACSNSPNVSIQQAALAAGSLAVNFPATAPGREVGQFLYLYDVTRLLINVNSGGQTWREILNTQPAGTALGPDEPNGTATVASGTSSVTVNNDKVTTNSVILVQAQSPGIAAAAPVQAAVEIPAAGSFTISIRSFAGALVNTTADTVFRYLIIG